MRATEFLVDSIGDKRTDPASSSEFVSNKYLVKIAPTEMLFYKGGELVYRKPGNYSNPNRNDVYVAKRITTTLWEKDQQGLIPNMGYSDAVEKLVNLKRELDDLIRKAPYGSYELKKYKKQYSTVSNQLKDLKDTQSEWKQKPKQVAEVFQPGKTNWEWARLGTNEVSAFFKVGDREYLWQAFTTRGNTKKWEIQFRLIRKPDTDPDDLNLFGTTGTGSSAEVMSTAVDITRAFLKDYGLDRVEEITFNAKEDSRIGLYAKMIKRLLPDWDLHKKYDSEDGMHFTLTDRRAYDKPENKLNELFDPKSGYQLHWDDEFGPEEIHSRAYDRQGNYIDINFVPVKPGIVDIEFSKLDSYEATGEGDEVAVFATVMKAIRKYLQGYQPKIIIFSGKGGSRASLYQKMIQRYAGQLGYKQFDLNKLSPEARQKLASSSSNAFVLRRTSAPVDEASYEGNLGMMEMLKFFKVASQDEKDYMKSLIAQGMQEEAWELLQKVTGEELVDEGFTDALKKGAAAGAIALGALGAGNVDAKVNPVMKPSTYQKVDKAAKPAEKETSTYNALSNNLNNEITVHKAAKKAGLKGAELAQFLAQMKHESWDFNRLKEKPQPGVKGYFAKRYDMKYSPKTAKILGNVKPGDGEKYHGRGFVQLTGRDNYRMAGEALGIDLLHKPELAAKPEVAAKIAVWYWQTRVKPYVNNFNDTTSVTKRINPALRGVDDRHENFKDYLRII